MFSLTRNFDVIVRVTLFLLLAIIRLGDVAWIEGELRQNVAQSIAEEGRVTPLALMPAIEVTTGALRIQVWELHRLS